MSSNVLKSLSDCYNFKDENSDNKSKAKPRQRLRTKSLTSKTTTESLSSKSNHLPKTINKESNKKDYKWRCNPFKDILNTAVWLNDIRADSLSTIDRVLTLLQKHISDDCKCVNISSTHLLIGNTFFERFLFNQKEFENKVINEENKLNETITVIDSNQSKNSAINDIPVQKESKLESDIISDLVNLHNMSILLEPLEKAVHHWSTALDLSLQLKNLTEDTIIGLKIYCNLSAVIQIYCFYNQIENRLKAAELLAKFCCYYGLKYSDISLSVNYYLVKTYLELGATNKAYNCLTRMPSSSSSSTKPEQQMPETFGKSLNLLAKCEVDYIIGSIDRKRKAAETLKLFIESDYLQKLTINRYYVKALSLLLATKFTSEEFNHSNYFQEFLEPIQMSLSILKRWNPWLSNSAKNNENQMTNSGDLDPFWYRFAVMNYSYEAMQLSANFYANIEMPIDSIFYYNSLFKLGRRYCSVVRLTKLLVIGSQLDIICDHKYSAQTKLSNAGFSLVSKGWSIDSESIFGSSTPSTISPDTRTAIDNRTQSLISDPEMDSIEVIPHNYESPETDNCEHNQLMNTTLWDFRKKLRININSDSDDSVPEFRKTFTFRSIDSTDYTKGVLEIFFTKIEIQILIVLINESDFKYILSQISDIHNNEFDSYCNHIIKPIIDKFIADYTLNEFQQHFDYYKNLKYKLIETIVTFLVQLKRYEEAVITCYTIKDLKPTTYEQRVFKTNLLYLEAFSKLELYKSKHNINVNKVWFEYNNNLLDSPPDSMLSKEQSITPTRPQNKMKSSVPKAPKQKLYLNEETEEYMKALQNKIYEEMQTKNCDSNKGNPFRMKTTHKLNFENDSELRSLSINETNTLSNEVPINTSKVMSKTSKTNVKTKVNQRITRSQASSLIKYDKYLDSEQNLDKRSKRSTSKSTKTTNSSELLDTELNLKEELEDLDEVFYSCLSLQEKDKSSTLNSTESDISLDSVKTLLKKMFGLMSSHPSSKIYVSINKLLADIYSICDISEDLVGYHFSESLRSTYRYRNLFIAEKKRKLNKSTKYNLNSILFCPEIDLNNSYRIFTNSLPFEWRIVQIMAVNNNESKIPDLMVCRYQRGRKPVFLQIKSNPQKIIKHFMTHFMDIIERSNASIINKDRETFWRLRYSLDEELKILLNSVEDTWFGPFKGILFGQLQSQSYQNMCQNLKSEILVKAIDDNLVCESQPLLEVLIESLPSLKYSEFRTAMKMIFKRCSDNFISYCFSKYEQMFCDVFPIETKEAIFTTYQLSPVGLILDTSLDSFPFECLPTLQAYNQSFFRTPSLRILSLMYNTFKSGLYTNGVNENKVYYVLNPSDNLAKTEEFFKQSFLQMKEWNGVIGKPPTPIQLKETFDMKDAYIFFGHGAGASYYRTIPEGLDSCEINCASVVIGCSSGKLFSEGKQLESFGTAYRFLMNGCPSYVGVLWDVTDKDIDKFSDHLLSNWFSKWKPELRDNKTVVPITTAVSKARSSCRLKYLIGAAPVVYGLPLFTNK